MMLMKRICLLSLLWLLVSLPARAVLTIEITRGADDAMPIAVVPFAWAGQGEVPEDIAQIIAADLQRSGVFRPLAEKDLIARPHQVAQVNYSDWRALNINHLVIGRVLPGENNSYNVQFQLLDVNRRRQLAGYSIRAQKAQLRRSAHQISDLIYEEITGERGAFDTFIAYITVTGDRTDKPAYQLAIADSDGHNEQVIYQSRQPILSPSWAPDGKHLAMTLSRDGNPEIYVMNIETQKLQRVTRNYAIDTEPAWLPDGRGLVFTSDRGGSPQLYQVNLSRAKQAAGRPERITFEGRYNARASVSPDGRHIAMVHQEQGKFRVAVQDRKSGSFRVVTNSQLDESPSFAPNGSMIIYATEENNRGVLSAVSVDGRAQQRLSLKQGDVREPAWSPLRSEQ